MDIRDFIYNEDLNDIHKVFLYYNFAHISTTITSVRNGLYKESDFKFDCKQNYLLKFPYIKEYEFEEIWKNTINKFNRLDINYFEEMGFNEADLIFKIARNNIFNFIKKKIENQDREHILLVKDALKNGPDNSKNFNIEYTDKNGDYLISFGLAYKGAYYDSNGNLKNNEYYYYPYYFSELKYDLLKLIEDLNYKSKKENWNKISENPIKKLLDIEEEVYKLKLIFKGKKGKKKVKLGISKFSVGAEFGGQEQETVEIICGNCGMSDKFKIEDQKQRILRCGKCGKLNKPLGKDNSFFD